MFVRMRVSISVFVCLFMLDYASLVLLVMLPKLYGASCHACAGYEFTGKIDDIFQIFFAFPQR